MAVPFGGVPIGAAPIGNTRPMRYDANIALINLDGDLDVTTVPGVRDTMMRLIDGGCRRIVINMENTMYIDSAGLGLILTGLRTMRARGGLLSLINVTPRIYRALCRMRVVDYMPIARAGAKREVKALDPSALPEWRKTFRVDRDHLSSARGRVGDILKSVALTPDEIFDMTLACGEALGNAIDHTDEDGVLVTVAAYPDRVEVDVADCGEGFEVPDEDQTGETDCYAERGRGIKLMQLLVDSVTISPKTSGDGMVVHLVKLYDTPDTGTYRQIWGEDFGE